MKTNKLLNFVLAGLLMTFVFSGCTSDFEEINTNTRVLAQLDQATIGNVYAYCQFNGLMNGWSYQTSQNLFADHYAEYYANTQTKFPSDRHILVGGWLNGAWRNFYRNAASNLDVVADRTNPAYVEGMEKQYALAQIWRVFMYQRITDYWGPIPYFEVGSAKNSIAYDSQESIYMNFFDLLDSANVVLQANAGGNAFGVHDQIYGGDIDKWIKFANTLRLRVAMRISDVNPSRAKSEAEKAVAGGVITSNDDNAIFQTTANSFNSLNLQLPWNEFRMSATMESVLKGYSDPRLDDYFSPTANSVAAGTPEYRGLRNGYDIAGLSAPDLHYDNLSTMGPRWNDVTKQSSNPIEVMLASEAYFLRAEGKLKTWNMGSETAQELYEKGIEMSLEFWGTDPADIATYIASTDLPVATHDAPTPVSDVPVAWSGDPAVQLEQIHTQKWLALYPDGWEAWSDLRRSELPKMYPRLFSDNPDVPADKLMRRVTYVDSEISTNNDGVTQGISLLGGPDNGATKLWWDK